MDVLRSCAALLVCRHVLLVLLCRLLFPSIGLFHYFVVIIICGHNIQFNIAELARIVHVLQIKPNEVVHYIIQHAQHMKWHVRTCTKLEYRGPELNLTCLR
jgi:hypothetical protein